MALCYFHVRMETAVRKAFNACGYDYEYFMATTKNQSNLDQKIRDYIERDIPVIASLNDTFRSFSIISGYDNDNFHFLIGEEPIPKACRYERLIFSVIKKNVPSLPESYKNAVMETASPITTPEIKEYSFGKQAFLDWTGSFQSNLFRQYHPDDKIWDTHENSDFSCCNMHAAFVCVCFGQMSVPTAF